MAVPAQDSPPNPARELRPSVTKQSEQQITLLDHTAVTESANGEPSQEASAALAPLSGLDTNHSLDRRWTKSSLQRQYTQRKYARWQEDRIVQRDDPQESAETSNNNTLHGKLGRGKGKVRGLLKRSKLHQVQEEDAVIDILYEHQRGFFTFGIPHFSSSSLLNFDPKPWTNAFQKPSPVSVANAQVPDPNWEWAWKSWYVDMSHDVDEEGWEYSLWFQNGTAWHGNHPWFHSFVRRRRWLRKRVRRRGHHADGQITSQQHMSEAHMLDPKYFTIHPTETKSVDESRAPSLTPSSGPALRMANEEEGQKEQVSIGDIATLLMYIKKASIDREKLVLFKRFISNATDELYYLSEEMGHIMSLFVFQNSRSHLLELLMEQVDQASNRRQEHQAQGEPEDANDRIKVDNLTKAIEAAEKEVRRLEYWSDIRKIVRKGGAPGAVSGSSTWPAHEWQGLDNSGPAANSTSTAKEAGSSGRSGQSSPSRQEDHADQLNSQHFEKLREEEANVPHTSSEDAYTTAEEKPNGKGKSPAT